jgi:hypothetical protein
MWWVCDRSVTHGVAGATEEAQVLRMSSDGSRLKETGSCGGGGRACGERSVRQGMRMMSYCVRGSAFAWVLRCLAIKPL